MSASVNSLVVISGCSGGGKTTLLDELKTRGHRVVEEPGRRIIAGQLRSGGNALPWCDPAAFARRAVELAILDMARADRPLADQGGRHPERNWIFFDRGLVDAACALEHATGEPALASLGAVRHYHRRVFLAPPWPEIYVRDDERRHGFKDAAAEYERLCAAYAMLGYDVHVLPKASVGVRADFVLRQLEATAGDNRERPASQPGCMD